MATILVVDDEVLIRSLVQRVLERRGHTVVTCATAPEALAQAGPFDLLLVDLVLPEMNGHELTLALRRKWPKLPVILMSGYLAQDSLVPDAPAMFLQKPMLPGAILGAVDRLLQNSEFRIQNSEGA